MPRTWPRQRKTIGRVMHEYEHGELKSGGGGKGGKVKSRRQAIAIALHEAGASKYESAKENERHLAQRKRSPPAELINRRLKATRTLAREIVEKIRPLWAVETRLSSLHRAERPHTHAIAVTLEQPKTHCTREPGPKV